MQVRFLEREPVKREAGVIPALSRSGDGNEMLRGASQRTVLIEMGSGNEVGCPKSEYRPAATTMEALVANRGCAEDAVFVDWNWQTLQCTIMLSHDGHACA